MNYSYAQPIVRNEEMAQTGKESVSYLPKSWDTTVEISVSSGIFTLPQSKVTIESSPASGNPGIKLLVDSGLFSDQQLHGSPGNVGTTSTSRQGVRRRAAPTIPGLGQSSTSRSTPKHVSMFLEVASIDPHEEKTNAVARISNEDTSSFSQLQSIAMRVNRPIFGVPYTSTFTKNVLMFRFSTPAEALEFLFTYRSGLSKHTRQTSTMSDTSAAPSSFVQLPLQSHQPSSKDPADTVQPRGAGATMVPSTTYAHPPPTTTTQTFSQANAPGISGVPTTAAVASLPSKTTTTSATTSSDTGAFEVSRPTLIGGTGVHMKNLGIRPVAGTASGVPVPFSEYSYRSNLDSATSSSTLQSLQSIPTVSTLSTGSQPTETARTPPPPAHVAPPGPITLDLQESQPAVRKSSISTPTAPTEEEREESARTKGWKKIWPFGRGKKKPAAKKKPSTVVSSGIHEARPVGRGMRAHGKMSKKEEARLAAMALESLHADPSGGMSTASITGVVPGSFMHLGHVGSKDGLTHEESMVLASVDIDNLPLEVKRYMRESGVRKADLRKDKSLLAVLLSTMGYNASHVRGGMQTIPAGSSTESATVRTPSPIETADTTRTPTGRDDGRPSDAVHTADMTPPGGLAGIMGDVKAAVSKRTADTEKPSVPSRRKKSVAFEEPEEILGTTVEKSLGRVAPDTSPQQHYRPVLQEQPSPVGFNRRQGMSGVTVESYKYADKSNDPFDASIGALPVITEASAPSISPADDHKFQTIVGRGSLSQGPLQAGMGSHIPSDMHSLPSPSYTAQSPSATYISPPDSTPTGYTTTTMRPPVPLGTTTGEFTSAETFQTARSTIPSHDLDMSPEYSPERDHYVEKRIASPAAPQVAKPRTPAPSGPAPMNVLSAIKGFDRSQLTHVDKTKASPKEEDMSKPLDSSMLTQLQTIVEARRKALGGRVTLLTHDSDSDSDWSVD